MEKLDKLPSLRGNVRSLIGTCIHLCKGLEFSNDADVNKAVAAVVRATCARTIAAIDGNLALAEQFHNTGLEKLQALEEVLLAKAKDGAL